MFCFLALLVFGVLGIFSASHRQLAKEALICVGKRLRFKPCEASFDDKVKAKLVGKLIFKSPALAKFVNRYFDWLSIGFLVLMIASTVWVGKGLYYYYMYGNCNGPGKEGFCVFDPAGENNKVSDINESSTCGITPPSEENLDYKALNLSYYPTLNSTSDKEIVFIGCFACPYTRKAYPVIKKLVDKYKPKLVFVHFPVKTGTDYLSYYGECIWQQDKKAFWQWVDGLFSSPIEEVKNGQKVGESIESLGIDINKFHACVKDPKTKEKIKTQETEVKKTGLYGTPTIFINGKAIVGPKPYRVYKRLLTGSLWPW